MKMHEVPERYKTSAPWVSNRLIVSFKNDNIPHGEFTQHYRAAVVETNALETAVRDPHHSDEVALLESLIPPPARFGIPHAPWAVKNWGTVLPDVDTRASFGKKIPGALIEFFSLGGPPVQAISTISLLFPSLTFSLMYRVDETMELGVFAARDGLSTFMTATWPANEKEIDRYIMDSWRDFQISSETTLESMERYFNTSGEDPETL